MDYVTAIGFIRKTQVLGPRLLHVKNGFLLRRFLNISKIIKTFFSIEQRYFILMYRLKKKRIKIIHINQFYDASLKPLRLRFGSEAGNR